MYSEARSSVPGAVLWSSTPGTETTVLPDGCLDLLWYGGELLVAGPDTRPYRSTGRTPAIVALRFAPGVGPQVLGVPAERLRDHRVRLADLWPVGELNRWISMTRTDPAAGLQTLAGTRLAAAPPHPDVLELARRCAAGRPAAQIGADLGWSERTIRRRSLAAFGYGPKMLSRVLRLQRSLAGLRRGDSLAEIATSEGYADQAHLSREVTELTGRSPSRHRGEEVD